MKNLLIIGFVWPEPASTAAGTRMLQLIDIFHKKNYKITFACAASKTNNSIDLKKINVQTKLILLNSAHFDSFVKKLNPSIVLFDRFLTEEQFGWRVSENCPNAIRILDTEDLHFLRSARQTAFNKNRKLSLELLLNDTTKREIASIYRCDLTLIISKYELKLLKKTFKIDKSLLQYVPFLLPKLNLKLLRSYPEFQDRNHFMSIGNFKHEPNWNAVLYLKTQIWPLIKKQLPEAQMLIYGAYTSEKVRNLHNEKDGFIIKGWAKTAEEVFTNAKVCLAPLQFGAGLKGKLVEAMQFGTPSVTTSIGAEGMHNKLPWNGFISDNPEEFSKNAIALYTNKKKWEQAQQNGVNIINNCYNEKKYTKKLFNNIECIIANILAHRLNNFTGALLMHHSIKSTKYMAKWIEEKNK